MLRRYYKHRITHVHKHAHLHAHMLRFKTWSEANTQAILMGIGKEVFERLSAGSSSTCRENGFVLCDGRKASFLESRKESAAVCSGVLVKQHEMFKVFVSATTREVHDV